MITLHNNYIFLPNFKKEKKTQPSKNSTKNTIQINIQKNIYEYILDIFGIPLKKEILETRFQINCTYKLVINNASYNVNFIINNVAQYVYLDIGVNGKTKTQVIHALEHIQEKMNSSKIEDNYIMIVSYDSISEYYCNKAYPKLNELERNLRKLLFSTYTVNFGVDYYKTTINTEIQNKAKKIIKSKGNKEAKEIKNLKKFFYSTEFSNIQKILFTKEYTKLEEDKKNEFLLKNENLTLLSNEELKNAFHEFSPKSDWDRLFAYKVNISNIEELLEEIRKSRNNIAHCKEFYKNEYLSFNKNANSLNSAIKKAIKITEEDDFDEKNMETLRNTLINMSSIIHQLQESIQEPLKTMKFDINSSISSFYETSKFLKSELKKTHDLYFSKPENKDNKKGDL